MESIIQETFMIDYDDSMNKDIFNDHIIDDEFYYEDFIESIISRVFEGMESKIKFEIGDFLMAGLQFLEKEAKIKFTEKSFKDMVYKDDYTFKK